MKKALIVVDMQNDFITGSLGTPEAQAIVPYVAAKLKEAKNDPDTLLIVLTMDTHGENYSGTREGRRLPVPHCVEGTDGWKLCGPVAALADAHMPLITKRTFAAVSLPAYIPEEVGEITLMGLCTDVCVISNAMLLKAHFPEVDVAVDAAGCAGVTKESHKTALEAMKMCQIDIKNAG